MSSGAYGGDEVGAVVIDLGSNSVRAGFAGEDAPKINFPTCMGVRDVETMQTEGNENLKSKEYIIGTNNITFPRAKVEIMSPLKNGMIENWDMFEAIIDHTFNSFLKTEIHQHPILMSEPAWNERSRREKLAEVMFEKYNIPAFFVCKSPVLSAFSSGRSTGVVLDSGHTHTTATPVHDGYVLQNKVVRSPLGGEFVLLQCRELLQSIDIDVVPQYMVKSKENVSAEELPKWEKKPNLPPVTESYHKYMVNQVLKDFSASVLQVSDSDLIEQDFNINLPKVIL